MKMARPLIIVILALHGQSISATRSEDLNTLTPLQRAQLQQELSLEQPIVNIQNQIDMLIQNRVNMMIYAATNPAKKDWDSQAWQAFSNKEKELITNIGTAIGSLMQEYTTKPIPAQYVLSMNEFRNLKQLLDTEDYQAIDQRISKEASEQIYTDYKNGLKQKNAGKTPDQIKQDYKEQLALFDLILRTYHVEEMSLYAKAYYKVMKKVITDQIPELNPKITPIAAAAPTPKAPSVMPAVTTSTSTSAAPEAKPEYPKIIQGYINTLVKHRVAMMQYIFVTPTATLIGPGKWSEMQNQEERYTQDAKNVITDFNMKSSTNIQFPSDNELNEMARAEIIREIDTLTQKNYTYFMTAKFENNKAKSLTATIESCKRHIEGGGFKKGLNQQAHENRALKGNDQDKPYKYAKFYYDTAKTAWEDEIKKLEEQATK